jgi:probable HAF family extracellular repeat protein
MTDLGTLGGTYSYAWSINDKNQIAGAALLAGDVDYHAFRYSNGTKADLGTLGGTYSEAFDINLNGELVGECFASRGRAWSFANGDCRRHSGRCASVRHGMSSGTLIRAWFARLVGSLAMRQSPPSISTAYVATARGSRLQYR